MGRRVRQGRDWESGSIGRKKEETIEEVVAKIRARRKKQNQPVVRETNEDVDRYGRRISVLGQVEQSPRGASFMRSSMPRFDRNALRGATGMAAQADYDTSGGERLTTPRSPWTDDAYRRPRRPKTTPQARVAAVSVKQVPSRPPSFGVASPRFMVNKWERPEPEPASKPFEDKEAWSSGVSFTRLPRFRKAFGERDVSRGIHGDGALDQVYEVDRHTSMAKTLPKSSRHYRSVFQSHTPRFSPPDAQALNDTRAPNLRLPNNPSIGPGTYDAKPTVRVRSATRRSATFSSTTSRDTALFWGNSAPTVETVALRAQKEARMSWARGDVHH